jgi:HTH-type transcriptional regulator/antitoxin HigA
MRPIRRKIKSKTQYQQALERFDELFIEQIGTAESPEAEALAAMIRAYEKKHFICEKPDRIDTVN